MDMESRRLKRYWLDQAFSRAGITHENWRPGRGLSENSRVVQAVYGYYGKIFLQNPYLQWAGMAGMIGPAFYAGFKDLGLVPDAVRRVFGRRARQLARSAAGDLGYYETTFLRMQKKIFEDQACMHEAYLAGGISEVDALYRARMIDVATLEAWQQIDTGHRNNDWANVARGNRTLLFREQYDIIDRFYAQMFHFHGPEGRAFTYLLTLIGVPSIRGARSYPERYPFTWRTVLSVQTPLADGNLAIFTDRWKLIESDTFPCYLELLRNNIDVVENELREPVAQRMVRYRLLARTPELVRFALTHWSVGIGSAAPLPEVSRHSIHRQAGTGDGLCIDLTHPPTRESAGLAVNADSRVWTNFAREPFDVTVTLPGGRIYHARAAVAVIRSSTPAGDPDQLVVQLPPSDLADAWIVIAGLAAEWGFPAKDATSWRTRANLVVNGQAEEPATETYSTHVFTADKVGFVSLEFQVSHHIGEEGEFVLAALFSWRQGELAS
jgi:hypothetical protein